MKLEKTFISFYIIVWVLVIALQSSNILLSRKEEVNLRLYSPFGLYYNLCSFFYHYICIMAYISYLCSYKLSDNNYRLN